MSLHEKVSQGLRRLRAGVGDWVENARNKEKILQEMLWRAGEEEKGYVPSLLPRGATEEQKALAWGFVAFAILSIKFVITENYQITNNSILALFYALLCALFIVVIQEYRRE